MDKFKFWVTWLKIVSILFAFFGLIIALFNQTKIFYIAFNNWINPVFWDNVQPTSETLHFQQWIYGLLGATCLMVGILIYFISKNAYAKKEKWAWDCLLMGLILWFVIDTPISFYFNVYFNVVFNLMLLLAVLLPLFLTKKFFKIDG